MVLRYILTRIALLIILAPLSAQAEDTTVASVLGVRSAAVANAIADGAKRAPYGHDELTDKMDAEASKFLNRSRVGRSPVAYDPAEAEKYQRPEDRIAARRTTPPPQDDLQQKQQSALEMLEFRRNVEDAMGKILSFQPTVQRVEGEPEWGPEPGPVPSPEDGWDYSSGRDIQGARDRLLATVESRDMTYAPVRSRMQQQVREVPRFREPALDQTLRFNHQVRGTQPGATETRRRIRVINDDSRESQRTAGGVVRLRR